MFAKKIIQNCFKQAQLYQFCKQKTSAESTSTFTLKKGQISQVIGAVVDVQFEG